MVLVHDDQVGEVPFRGLLDHFFDGRVLAGQEFRVRDALVQLERELQRHHLGLGRGGQQDAGLRFTAEVWGQLVRLLVLLHLLVVLLHVGHIGLSGVLDGLGLLLGRRLVAQLLADLVPRLPASPFLLKMSSNRERNELTAFFCVFTALPRLNLAMAEAFFLALATILVSISE